MKPSDLFCSFASGVLLKHLRALQQEAPGVRLAQDLEYIHRMRVASRRLRAAMPLFKACLPRKKALRWIDQVKKITQALGAARDTDVQLDLLNKITTEAAEPRYRPGLQRLALRIGQQRAAQQGAVIEALDELDKSQFFPEMEAFLLTLAPELPPGTPFPHQLFAHSAASITLRLDEFLYFEPFVHQKKHGPELHAMRIAAKQLRYTLETFAVLYPGELQVYLQVVKTSQELLGDLHDCDVWLGLLPLFFQEEYARTLQYYGHANPFRPLQPGLEYFERNRQEEWERNFLSFGEAWEKWKSAELWKQFRSTIAAPVYPDVFPLAPEENSSGD